MPEDHLRRALAHYDPLDAVRPLLAKARPEDVGFVNSMRYLDFKLYLGAGVLPKVDRASMAVSLETRPVFLHRDLLSLAGRIPRNASSTATRRRRLSRPHSRHGCPRKC